LIEFTNSYY